MNDQLEAQSPSDDARLARWLGRREAFGMIAGRCSAADVECLRQIRDQKLYVGQAPNWDEFCTRQLKASRRKIDTDIRLLEEFGPAYFHLTQLTRITVDDYRAIAPHVSGEGVNLDGEVIALLPENADRLAEALASLRKRIQPSPATEVPRFETIVRRCESVNALLDQTPYGLDVQQKVTLAAALCRMRELAARLGVRLVEV